MCSSHSTQPVVNLSITDAEQLGEILGISFSSMVSDFLQKGKEHIRVIYFSALFRETLTIYKCGKIAYHIFDLARGGRSESYGGNLPSIENFLTRNNYQFAA